MTPEAVNPGLTMKYTANPGLGAQNPRAASLNASEPTERSREEP